MAALAKSTIGIGTKAKSALVDAVGHSKSLEFYREVRCLDG